EYLFIVRGEDEDHAPGTLGFPGGTLEAPPGESGVLAATARREVREEVGVDIAGIDLVTSTVFELDTGRACLNVLVVAEHAAGEAYVADPEEVGDVAWRTAESVFDADETPPWTAELLEDVVAYREG
ncbi:MAG: NUDIX hydrolase, partial [Halolamina sp.]